MSTTAGDDDGSTAGSMSGTGDSTGTPPGDSGSGGSSGTAGETGPGEDPTEACLGACENGIGCEKGDPSECPAACEEDVGFAEDDGCVAEGIAYWNCIAALDCGQYDDWFNEVGDPYPCQDTDEAFFNCIPEGGSSSGGADSSSSGGG